MNLFRRRSPGARQVRVERDSNAPIVTGDNNTLIVNIRSESAFALSFLPDPPQLPTTAGPAALLAARHEIVPFVGREGEVRHAQNWLHAPARRAVHLITGPGGLGKSRFAFYVGRLAAKNGWRVLVARREVGSNESASHTDGPAVNSGPSVGTLILIDYADRWDQSDLLTAIARPIAAQTPVRFLLMARSADFWESLAATLEDLDIAASEEKLSTLDSEAAARQLMFDAAARAFAEHLPRHSRTGRHGQRKFWSDVASRHSIDLMGPGFELPLAVHMSALLAVLEQDGNDHEGNNSAATDLTRRLLLREQQHWVRMSTRQPQPTGLTSDVMALLVFIATLTRGVPRGSAAELLRGLSFAEPEKVLRGHALCYPPTTVHSALEPLYPDRLGEDFIAAMLTSSGSYTRTSGGVTRSAPKLPAIATPEADRIVVTLLELSAKGAPSTGPLRRACDTAVVVLCEAAARWEHVARDHLLPGLRKNPSLITDISSTSTLPAVASTIDHPDGGVASEERLLAAVRSLDNPVATAGTLSRLTARYIAAGRPREGMITASEAIDVRRDLVRLDRRKYLPGLAIPLSEFAAISYWFGRQVKDHGHGHDYLDLYTEVVSIYRELAHDDRGAYLPNFADAVRHLADYLAKAGLHAEALLNRQEAVKLYRELAATHDREAYLPILAELTELLRGQPAQASDDSAMVMSREVVAIYRELAVRNPTKYLPALARSISGLGTLLLDTDHRAEAIAANAEAVEIYRQLAALERDAYLPTLGRVIHSLAVQLSRADRCAEALSVGREAVAIRRTLVQLNGERYLPALARSLDSLVIYLTLADAESEALAAAQEAVRLRERLAMDGSDRYSEMLKRSERLEGVVSRLASPDV